MGLSDVLANRTFQCSASLVVNAAGPYVPDVGHLTGTATNHRLVFSKGIHLVVPRITDSGRILAFFDDGERLFYVLPMGERSVCLLYTSDAADDTP